MRTAAAQRITVALVQRRVRVAVVSPVAVHCEGLTTALAAHREVEVVPARAPTCDGPDLVVVDGAAGDDRSLELLRQRFDLRTPVVALGVVASQRPRYRRAGFDACLGPQASIEQLVSTVRRLATPSADGPVPLDGRGSAANRPPPGRPLTARELQVLTLVSEGLSNGDIASRLHIEVATVKNHVHNLLGKLGLRRRGQAAHWLRSGAAASTGD